MKIARENETGEFFRKNLKLLPSWVTEPVRKMKESELWEKIEVFYNAEGYPVCRYRQEGKAFAITSQQPVAEMEQWYKSLQLQGTGCIILYGCGFGYPLFELFARKKPHTLVVLFERDMALLTAMLHYFDLEPLLESRTLAILPGDPEDFSDAFEQLFFSIVFISSTYPTLAFTHAAQRNFKEAYLKIHQYIFSRLQFYLFYLGNDHRDNLIGLNNLMANAGEFLRNPYISCLKDRFKGVPAFIAANGPSLDKNLHELEKVKGRGVLLCAESAIVPLIKNGIVPDILTVVERTKYTYTYHFENRDYPKELSLICLGLVDPQVFPSFAGPKIPLFRKWEAINEWMGSYLGDGSGIDAGTNVSHLAFELAVYLGCDPIIFVGQDYAYGAEGLTHSRDSIYYEEKGEGTRRILESKSIVFVEGNNGEQLPTNQLWKDFRQGLEWKIGKTPGRQIINATEGGARIAGTACRILADVIEEYCNQLLPDRVFEIIAEARASIDLAKRKERLTEFAKSAENYASKFQELSRMTNRKKLECQEMLRLARKADYKSHYTELEAAYNANIAMYPLFILDDLYRCFFQQAVFAFYYQMDYLGFIDTQQKIIDIFTIQYNFFDYLNIAAQSVSVCMENAEELLQELKDEPDREMKMGCEGT